MKIQDLLDSWDRQCAIIDDLAELVTEENRKHKPSHDGMSLDMQLCHIHETRYYWLSQVSQEAADEVPSAVKQVGDDWLPLDNLDDIRKLLRISSHAIRQITQEHIEKETAPLGPYDHPALFLQHMVWHEGYHAALILLGLRLAGCEPDEEWEDQHIWGRWRNYG